jgi:hypothetical protein
MSLFVLFAQQTCGKKNRSKDILRPTSHSSVKNSRHKRFIPIDSSRRRKGGQSDLSDPFLYDRGSVVHI